MTETPTSRNQAGTTQGPPNGERLTLQTGHRHRCATCHEHGKAVKPAAMCHHCGRLFCSDCAPRVWGPLEGLFEYQETRGVRGRGRHHSLLGGRGLEAAHCEYCQHAVPRMIPWMTVGGALAILLVLLFRLGSVDPMIFIGLPLLVFVLWAFVGFAWRAVDKMMWQQLFFPVDAVPVLELEEEFVADGVLDGSYQETFRPEMPRGKIKVTVPLVPSMAADVNRFGHTHGLSEETLAEIPASAGSIILEEVVKVMRPSPTWPEGKARRWELAAPIHQWPMLWQDTGESAKVMEFHYQIDWLIPRLPFTFSFPIQVLAHFPHRGNRETLELTFAVPGWMSVLGPMMKKVILEPGEGLPEFSLQDTGGRPLPSDSAGEVVIADVPFIDKREAHVRLHFATQPSQTEAAWLNGTVQVKFAETFSKLKMVAFYDPFGMHDRHFVPDTTTTATLHFRVNVASIPFEGKSVHLESIALQPAPAERDDSILQALGQATRLVKVHESSFEPLADSDTLLPPTRDIMGHWPMGSGDDLSLAVFHINIHPSEKSTHVRVQVEAPVTDPAALGSRAQEIAKQLQAIVVQADESFGGGDGGGQGGSDLG
nr:hypothetical protein [Ardenticatenales bacterium]